MLHRFKAKLAPFPKQFLWLAVIAMIIAAVVVLLALWFTFIPQMPPTLEEIRSDTLADATEETYIAPPSGDRSFWDSGDDAPVELSVDPPKPAEPEIEQAGRRQEVLDQVATVTEAPDVLSPDEVAFVEAQMKAENAKPEDVVLAISRKRRTRSPKFLDQPPESESAKQESVVAAAKTAAPGYVALGFKPKPAIYPIGHALEARLLSDIVAIQGLATVALVEVFERSGKPLGTSLVNVNLAPRGKAVVHLEGNLIADTGNRGIRGNFRAFSPNGQVGLLGETKTYWLRHVGMTLYRTALGILPLRLADTSAGSRHRRFRPGPAGFYPGRSGDQLPESRTGAGDFRARQSFSPTRPIPIRHQPNALFRDRPDRPRLGAWGPPGGGPMIAILCLSLISIAQNDLWQAFAQHPEKRALLLAYLAGEIDTGDLRDAALAGLTPYRRQSTQRRREEIFVPTNPAAIEFYGGGLDGPCEGFEPRGPAPHPFRVPSYVSLVYQKVIYDPSAESWAQAWDGDGDRPPDLGARGEPVGVAYTGYIQRIWGHGFYMELETDPMNGVHQRIELVHFREEDCEPLPGIRVPCLKVKDLYTFHWSVRDEEFQVRKADSNWRSPLNLLQFYYKTGEAMVAGTAAEVLHNLEGFDAGYADGKTTVYSASPDFPWYPCADFSFQAFHGRTQFRASPWPGLGMPLLSFGTAKVTDKQRRRTADDFEAARGQPTMHDVEAGTAAVLGADAVETDLLDTSDYSKRATKEAIEKMARYQEELALLGQTFPATSIGDFARMALRAFDHQRLVYVFDLDRFDADCLCFPKRDELAAKLPAWAYNSITNDPGRGFSYAVVTWMDLDWRPPYLAPRYAEVLNHPGAIIPALNNLDERAATQTDMVTDLVRTTDLVHKNTDPNHLAAWPNFGWPDLKDPDTYWTIYFTWD